MADTQRMTVLKTLDTRKTLFPGDRNSEQTALLITKFQEIFVWLIFTEFQCFLNFHAIQTIALCVTLPFKRNA